MAITFTKSGNKVIVVDGSNTLSLDATLSIYKHPSQTGFLVISSAPDLDGKLENYYTFKYSDVTTPSVGSVDLLIKELGENYFNVTAGGGGDATAANQALQITEAETSNSYLRNIESNTGATTDILGITGIRTNKYERTIAGDLAVSQKHVLAALMNTRELNTLFLDTATVGIGSITYDADNKGAVLSVTNAGDRAIIQTKQHYPYFPDKPQNSTFTGINFQPLIGKIKRIGRFTTITQSSTTYDFDGVFLATNDTEITLNLWRLGVPVVSAIPQSAWNLDPLDGTGSSGLALNPTNFNIYNLQYLLLGGSGVRFYVLIEDALVAVHDEKISGTIPSTMFGIWFQPFRVEIESTSGAGSFTFVCADIALDGVVDNIYVPSYHIGTSATFVTSGVRYMAAAMRLNNREAFVKLVNAIAVSTSNDGIIVSLHVGGSVTGSPAFASHPIAPLDFADGNSTNVHSGGIQIGKAGYSLAGNQAQIDLDGLYSLGTLINGDFETLYICFTPVGANLTAFPIINFQYL